ncbi:enhanced serine sensitivity protein SseB [Sodalis glossinidius str. 'morsitans']|nr:enhanced serine sensitivity protein SseB [Sodalis glossinidius]CRL45949.1 enhanced serine sensitivity protein SseB [Sodalis glossinidius str. 'morsitans']
MTSSQDNALEEALQRAAGEPAYRPAFFKLLLAATVYVPGEAGDDWIAGAVRDDGASPVTLQHWEKQYGGSAIPFFTSVSALERAVTGPQPFVALPVRTLFAMTAGAELFLNPKLPYGKSFAPDEVAALLSNDGDALTEWQVLAGEMRMTLSEPKDMPVQMVDSLTVLFAQYKQVRRAFLVQVRDDAEQEPHWLIGLECDSDAEEAIQETGQVATDTAPDALPVDICLVEEGEAGISHYFLHHITPFYERRWGSWLRSVKDAGRS